jgi:hypothetical protein
VLNPLRDKVQWLSGGLGGELSIAPEREDEIQCKTISLAEGWMCVLGVCACGWPRTHGDSRSGTGYLDLEYLTRPPLRCLPNDTTSRKLEASVGLNCCAWNRETCDAPERRNLESQSSTNSPAARAVLCNCWAKNSVQDSHIEPLEVK